VGRRRKDRRGEGKNGRNDRRQVLVRPSGWTGASAKDDEGVEVSAGAVLLSDAIGQGMEPTAQKPLSWGLPSWTEAPIGPQQCNVTHNSAQLWAKRWRTAKNGGRKKRRPHERDAMGIPCCSLQIPRAFWCVWLHYPGTGIPGLVGKKPNAPNDQ